AVLVLELLEPLRVRNLHAAVLPLPGIQGLSAHAEPAAQLAHVRACLRLLDRSDLLLLREPALAHDSSAFGAPESDYKWIRFRGSAHWALGRANKVVESWTSASESPSRLTTKASCRSSARTATTDSSFTQLRWTKRSGRICTVRCVDFQTSQAPS